jgi:hypothetical protein
MRIGHVLVVAVLVAVVSVLTVSARTTGTLDPPGPPDSTNSYTLEDIYDRLGTGAQGAQSTFTEPISKPGTSTMHTLDEIYDLMGRRAPIPKTGQVTIYAPGDDGDLQKGVSWPNPRFADNGDGTVTDNLTGLIWLKDRDCMGTEPWGDALTQVGNLNSGMDFGCDGYAAGAFSDWRLPNINELRSLVDRGHTSPSLPPGHPFVGDRSYDYWSSTTYAHNPGFAWRVVMATGPVDYANKTAELDIWPVRDKQLDANTPPDQTFSHTLDQIYDRLDTGAASSPITFTEPISRPGIGMMHTLDELYDLVEERGTALIEEPGTALIGMTARIPKTGQDTSYAPGDDGDLKKGVAWPNPRFTDDGDGTVTDNLTGLIWLKDAGCMGSELWDDALTQVGNLNSGTDFECDDYAAGTFGDWRLPNVRELFSLVDFSQYWLVLPDGCPFVGVNPIVYWSSTTSPYVAANAWDVHMATGSVNYVAKSGVTHGVLPVRGGHTGDLAVSTTDSTDETDTTNIDETHKWAWDVNVGWINFRPGHGGVTVYSDHLEGYAWGENIGWIRLGSDGGGGTPSYYANTAADNYGVNNDASGNLSGYAWGTSVGWINFNPVYGGVTIDTATGTFDGYAWGENIGWIHFRNTDPAYSVVTTYYERLIYLPVMLREHSPGANHPPNVPSNPSPPDGMLNQGVNVNLSWIGGDPDPGDTATYDVYLEAADSTPEVLICNDVTTALCDLGTLSQGRHYYWQVIARDSHGMARTGPIWDFATEEPAATLTLISPNGDQSWHISAVHDLMWSFTGSIANARLEYSKDGFSSDVHTIVTATLNDGSYPWIVPNDPSSTVRVRVSDVSNSSINDISDANWAIVNNAPRVPSKPSPTDGATNQPIAVTLSWTGGDPDGDKVTYDVHFGPGTARLLVCDDVTSTTCDLGTLSHNTEYSWQVVASDRFSATTTGPVWHFATLSPGPLSLHNPSFDNFFWYEFHARHAPTYPVGVWLPDGNWYTPPEIWPTEGDTQDWRLWLEDGTALIDSAPDIAYAHSAPESVKMWPWDDDGRQIAGIYQLVENTTPCFSYKFRMHGYSRQEGPNDSLNGMKVGIEPTGWTLDPDHAPGVHDGDWPATMVWGTSRRYDSDFGPLEVTAEALDTRITVFTYADAVGGNSHKIHWDTGSLEEIPLTVLVSDPDHPVGDDSWITFGPAVLAADTSARVEWNTSGMAVSQVYYREADVTSTLDSTSGTRVVPTHTTHLLFVSRPLGEWLSTVLDTTPKTAHLVIISDLLPGRIYEYYVVSRGVSGDACVNWVSDRKMFMTHSTQ